MVGLFLLGVVIVPLGLVVALNKTAVWWLPTALFGAFAVITAEVLGPFALIMLCYAAILFVFSVVARRRRARFDLPPPAELPVATVRSDR